MKVKNIDTLCQLVDGIKSVSNVLTSVSSSLTILAVIKSFRSKALAELWSKGRTRRIDAKLQRRILARLTALNRAGTVEEMRIPGFDFHALKGCRPTRYTVHVNGPWCVTFEFDRGDAVRVDLEQYH